MKRLVIVFASLLCWSNVAAQITIGATVRNIPGGFWWDYRTDYGESGHLTIDTGSKPVNFDLDFPDTVWSFFDKHGDTLYYVRYEHSYATIVFAQTQDSVKSIDVSVDVPSPYYYGCNYSQKSTIHLEDVPIKTSGLNFSFNLQGSELLGHHAKFAYQTCNYVQSSNQSYANGDTSSGVMNPNSSVSFSISKAAIFSSVAGASERTQRFNVGPTPADKYLNVDLAGVAPNLPIEVTDILGRQVYKILPPSALRTVRVNLVSLPSGTYSIKVGNSSSRFVVNH